MIISKIKYEKIHIREHCFIVPYKAISAGKIEHLNKLQNLVEKTYFANGQCVTLPQYKSIMREVFRLGTIFDDTINSDVTFEIIKRKDVI